MDEKKLALGAAVFIGGAIVVYLATNAFAASSGTSAAAPASPGVLFVPTGVSGNQASPTTATPPSTQPDSAVQLGALTNSLQETLTSIATANDAATNANSTALFNKLAGVVTDNGATALNATITTQDPTGNHATSLTVSQTGATFVPGGNISVNPTAAIEAAKPPPPPPPAQTVNKSLCFITTAVCETMGKADDCEELQTLRRFRDNVLKPTIDGAEHVERYYREAPGIVEAIKRRHDATEIFRHFYTDYILPAVGQINDGRNFEAFNTYRKLFFVAKAYAFEFA